MLRINFVTYKECLYKECHGTVSTLQVNKFNFYAPMIYTAPCIMFWMRAYPLRGPVGGGWAMDVDLDLYPTFYFDADRDPDLNPDPDPFL